MMSESSETYSINNESYEEYYERQLLGFFERRGFVFSKEDLNKPATLRQVLELIMMMEVEK